MCNLKPFNHNVLLQYKDVQKNMPDSTKAREMKLLGPIKHLDNRMRRSAYLRQHKERMLQGQVVQPISPIQQATRETTAKSQRPSDKINLINEDISKLEKL